MPARAGLPRTLGALALTSTARHGGVALMAPGRAPTTYREFGAAVREIAGGLASLGIEPGDRVAVLAGTRPERTLADFGAPCAGAVVEVQRHVDAVNARFARIEQVKRFVILPRDLSQAAGELTPTMKVRRPAVEQRYADVIDTLYG